MIYNVRLYNDMGHLMTDPKFNKIPENIRKFVYSKSDMYVYKATDKSRVGCCFYILKDGLKDKWTYHLNNDIVNITYDLDKFNKDIMTIMTIIKEPAKTNFIQPSYICSIFSKYF